MHKTNMNELHAAYKKPILNLKTQIKSKVVENDILCQNESKESESSYINCIQNRLQNKETDQGKREHYMTISGSIF